MAHPAEPRGSHVVAPFGCPHPPPPVPLLLLVQNIRPKVTTQAESCMTQASTG